MLARESDDMRRARESSEPRSPESQVVAAAVLAAAGCGGTQSALDPAGRAAARIATLFWWMAGGAALVWAAMVALAVYAIWARRDVFTAERGQRLIVVGGVALPTAALTALLTYGLALLPELVAPAPPGSLTIAVVGEQWWWRVRYMPGTGDAIELANEIRLPVGAAAEVRLESADVIHSFWVPSLAGKMDAIPGRTTRLVLEPTKTGTFRGVCAEYCGSAHALMAFDVVVLERDEFERWLEAERAAARPPATPHTARGGELFLANGCAACHTIRGTAADGVVGPDLTHVAGRLRLGAGTLHNEAGGFRRWIAGSERLKPGVHMPAFDMLADDELDALAAYLEGLR
jgi:cytochrome c oxidase subunit II